LITQFNLFFKTGHLLTCHILRSKIFLFLAIFSCIAGENSIWISELLLVGVAFQAVYCTACLQRSTVLVMSCSVFEWNGIVQYCSQYLLQIGSMTFDITESARFVFSHYVIVYNKDYSIIFYDL